MAIQDQYIRQSPGLTGPATDAVAITPSDTVDISEVVRGIYVGVGGDINLITKDGSTVLLKNATAGSVIPIRASRVKSSSTTATNLIGFI